MIPVTPREEIWGYRWECDACHKIAIKATPTEPPKCPVCGQAMVHK